MRIPSVAIFAAGFLAGGIVLGGVVAQAGIVVLNASKAGVQPNSEGSLYCVTGSAVLRPIAGLIRNTSLDAPGGTANGISLQCPA